MQLMRGTSHLKEKTYGNSHETRNAASELGRVAQTVADDLRKALGIEVAVTIYSDAEQLGALRRLAEKQSPQEWDVLLYDWGGQTTDWPPLELHRGFVGASGAYRAGPIAPEFKELYEELVRETSTLKQAQISYHIDKFVYEEALALFLCAPQTLYAVNKRVNVVAYRTTFELAECRLN
jgi:ABC-type transport system substrate-binding protein